MCKPQPANDAPAPKSDTTRIGFFYGFVMLVTGTMCTLITKQQYGIRADGTSTCVVDGAPSTNCLFDKPWFGVMQMKLGMAGCLVVAWLQQMCRKSSLAKAPKPDTFQPPSWNTILWMLVPAALDLLCTILANVGLLWISSSIHQMTKGSLVVFNAYILVHFMGRRLFAYQFVSISLVVLAITMVAYVGLMHSSSAVTVTAVSQTNQAFGFACIVLSQFVTAWQIVTEEWLLTQRHVNPAVLVGWEGLWGLLFFVVLGPLLMLTPASTSGIALIWHEDFADTVVKLSNSPTLVATVLLFCVCTGLYNYAGNCVTMYMSSVMCCILDTCRALGIWIAALVLYYEFGFTEPNSAGEKWTSWSWLELAGFIMLAYGTLLYKKVVCLPIPYLYEAEDAFEASQKMGEATPLVPSNV